MAEIVDVDKWKGLMKAKALELGFTESDLNASKVAGYMTSLNLETFKNSVLLNTIGIRERFISTAKKDESIIKTAADRNMEVYRATPSYAKLFVLLSVADIKAYMLENEEDVFILSKDNPIYIDETPFSLYYDIAIKIENNGIEDIYTVKYVQGDDGYVNPLDAENVYTKPISIVRTIIDELAAITSDNNKAIGLVLDVRQYIRQYSQCRYVQNIETEIHNATYSNQLADFTVRYAETEYAADSVKRYLKKKNSFIMEDTPDETIYYKMSGTTSILLFNRLVGNFKPATNSLLDVECLSTLGTAGNFKYTGTNMVMTIPGIVRNKIVILTQPCNGVNSPDIDTLKSSVMNFISTRGTISNEEDLKKYYKDNLGLYKIDKLKHDFRSLTYSIVAALKSDTQNMYFPTNTLDLLYYIQDDDVYEQDKYIILNTDRLLSYEYGFACNIPLTESDVLNYAYTTPYSLVYNKNTNTVSIYDKVFERTYPVSLLNNISDTSYSIIMNRFKISKTSKAAPIISSYITTTRDIESDTPVLGTFNGDGLFLDNGTLVVRAIFKNQGIFVGYVDAVIDNYSSDDKYYSIKVDNFAKEYPYGNNVMLYLKDKQGDDMEVLTPISNIFVEFEIYTKSTDGVYRDHGYSDLYEYYRLTTYKSDEIALYKNLSYVNNILVTTMSSGLLFKNIPLIGYDAFINDSANISAKIQYELDRIDTYYNLTPQNHQLCLRFANTYGFAARYKIGYTSKKDLDQLAIMLQFNIKLKTGKTLAKSTVITFINDYIMKLDFENGDFLHISDVIDKMKEEFSDYISFIEFNGINELSSAYQYIGLDLTQTGIDKTIPEILNVNQVYDIESNTYIPEIYVEFL